MVTSAESAALDKSSIDGGIPSRALMQRAGAAAASEIALRFRDRLGAGALVFAGPGNNGGDAWVVARGLAAAGVAVRVVEPTEPRTPDAIAERALAVELLGAQSVSPAADESASSEAVVVDGLLGTGATGAPRGSIAGAVAAIQARRARGATVVALDVPSGMDASTGEAAGEVAAADLTLTFGTVKRGHLVSRETCGTVVVLDIGLRHESPDAGAGPRLVDEAWVAAQVPRIAWDAHKGTRKKLAIVGGARGFAGAAILAARAALRSGVGMVKLVVADATVPVVQESEPHALCAAWPADDETLTRDVTSWADAIVIGPGLGLDDASDSVLDRLLGVWTGPTLIDADALNLLSRRRSELSRLLAGRPTLLTPHPVEFGRLIGRELRDVLDHRFEIGVELARASGAVVLLKGVPTIVSSPNGERLVSATGTPALATGGSGDVLSGIAGTLLAQTNDPFVSGAAGAWVHGRAAERATAASDGIVRGIALDDVVRALHESWSFDTRPARYPVLAELPMYRGTT